MIWCITTHLSGISTVLHNTLVWYLSAPRYGIVYNYRYLALDMLRLSAPLHRCGIETTQGLGIDYRLSGGFLAFPMVRYRLAPVSGFSIFYKALRASRSAT